MFSFWQVYYQVGQENFYDTREYRNISYVAGLCCKIVQGYLKKTKLDVSSKVAHFQASAR
jgi:hypothetical protein